MAAAPQRGTLVFQGKSGAKYSYSVYASDVANAFVTFGLSGVAGTGTTNFVIAPEDMQLVDASIVTGLTDTTSLVLWLNDAIVPNSIIQDANIVNTIQNRSFPTLAIRAGRKIQFAQV